MFAVMSKGGQVKRSFVKSCCVAHTLGVKEADFRLSCTHADVIPFILLKIVYKTNDIYHPHPFYSTNILGQQRPPCISGYNIIIHHTVRDRSTRGLGLMYYIHAYSNVLVLYRGCRREYLQS